MGLPPTFTWKTNELKLRALWTWTGIDTRMKWLASLSFKPTVLSLFLARTVGCLAASFCFIWLKGNWGGQVWPQREYPAHRCGWHTMEPGERLLLLAPFLYSQLPPGDHFLISFPVWGECIDTAERLPLSLARPQGIQLWGHLFLLFLASWEENGRRAHFKAISIKLMLQVNGKPALSFPGGGLPRNKDLIHTNSLTALFVIFPLIL